MEEKSRKRKLSVTDDPDDPGVESINERTKIRKVEQLAQSRLKEKIETIINREFTVSLKAKEEEVENIDKTLIQVQKALHLVRYGTISNYYAAGVAVNQQTSAQPANVSIHPAVRSVLSGKTPAKSHQDVKNQAKASEEPSDGIKIKEEPLDDTLEHTPGYVPPLPAPKNEGLPVLDPRSVQHKFKRRFVIGNVSRWIACDQREDLSTHKWMIYVRGDKAEPNVSDVVSKVRFLIHPSYQPHDLVEVDKAPFHLTRRGWGEFPARIQIHFKNKRDKPVDVIHHLKLDRTYTGLQTQGAETMVDIWLHNNTLEEDQPKGKPEEDVNSALVQDLGGWVIPHRKDDVAEVLGDTNLLTDICNDFPEVDQKCLNEVLEELEPENSKQTFVKCTDKAGEPYYLPVSVLPNNCKKQVNDVAVPKQQSTLLKPRRTPPLASKSLRLSNVPHANGDHSGGKVGTDSDTSGSEMNGHASPVPGSLLKKSARIKAKSLTNGVQRQSLLKRKPDVPAPGTSLLKKFTPTVSLDQQQPTSNITELEKAVPKVRLTFWNRILGRNEEDTQAEIEYRLLKKGISTVKRMADNFTFLSDKLFHLNHSVFRDVESCILYLAKFFPVVTPNAKDSAYKVLHPYASVSLSEFRAQSLPKQLACEWSCAKSIERVIRNVKGLQTFKTTTKEILKTLRDHGYCYSQQASTNAPGSGEEIKHLLVSAEHYLTPEVLTRLKEDGRLDSPEKLINVVDITEKDQDDTAKSVQVRRSIPTRSTEATSQDQGPVHCLMLPEDNNDLFKLANELAGSVGAKLSQSEKIAPNVTYPAAQKVLLRACKVMSDYIIRKSFKQACLQNEGKAPAEVTAHHVMTAIQSDPNLDLFTGLGLGKAVKAESQS